jgi:hypothetical protein
MKINVCWAPIYVKRTNNVQNLLSGSIHSGLFEIKKRANEKNKFSEYKGKNVGDSS